MKNYIVTWTVDVEAETPREAASQALTIQRDLESTAVVFSVSDGTDDILIDLAP